MRCILTLFFLFSLIVAVPTVSAQVPASPILLATDEASIATDEASATASARIDERIEEKNQTDITETRGAVKSRLAQHLDANPIGALNPGNFIQHSIRQAVDQGVPANMLVLMLMFPVVASLIAASRHVIGLEGFGIYAPAVLAVALVSTGIGTGVLLFLMIILSAMIGRPLLGFLKLQYLPRTALLLWFVSLAIFTLLLLSPYFVGFFNIAAVGIFPVLVLVLLSENFIGAQSSMNLSRVLQLTMETLILAVASAFFMGLSMVQEFVILHPEVTILFVALLDLAVGKYTGLRVTEYLRFKSIIDSEEE